MGGGDDVARGFPHSAYCYVLLQPQLMHINEPAVPVANQAVTCLWLPAYRIAAWLEENMGEVRCMG